MAYDRFARWAYRGGRPNRLATLLNRFWAAMHARGIWPDYLVTLEVKGRRSGRTITLPLVMAVVDDRRFFVSMLGEGVNWVENARASGWHVALHHGRREEVTLVEVPVEDRAPIIKAYLAHAPGGRPHVPVTKDAPLEEFEAIASRVPVFEVIADSPSPRPSV